MRTCVKSCISMHLIELATSKNVHLNDRCSHNRGHGSQAKDPSQIVPVTGKEAYNTTLLASSNGRPLVDARRGRHSGRELRNARRHDPVEERDHDELIDDARWLCTEKLHVSSGLVSIGKMLTPPLAMATSMLPPIAGQTLPTLRAIPTSDMRLKFLSSSWTWPEALMSVVLLVLSRVKASDGAESLATASWPGIFPDSILDEEAAILMSLRI